MAEKAKISWLDDGDKFALVALSLKLEAGAKTTRGGEVFPAVEEALSLDDYWRGWLGSIAVEITCAVAANDAALDHFALRIDAYDTTDPAMDSTGFCVGWVLRKADA